MNTEWEILKEKGNEEFRKKNYNAAISLYSDAIDIYSNEVTLYGNRSNCYKAIGKFKMAKLDLNKALNIDPKNTKNLKRLANIHIMTGSLGEAEQLIQKCVNLEPKDHTHILELNKIKTLIKEWENLNVSLTKEDSVKAEEIALKLLNDLTDYPALKSIYIQSLLNNVKLVEAINYLSGKLTSDEKSEDEFKYLTALALYYDGQYEKARKFLHNLLQQVNDNDKYNHLFKLLREIEKQKEQGIKCHYIANELFKQKDYEKAIDSYTKLLELDPSNKNFNSTILNNRALCYQKLNKLNEALRDSNKSIAANERNWKAYMRRGNIYMALNMFEEAKYDYQKVKDNEPNNSDAHKLLEESKKEEKKAKKRDYYKILEIDRSAGENEIRKAYKKLALKWHPDRNSNSEESQKLAEKMFRDINDAYSVLSDSKKKQMYDNGCDPLNPEEANGMGEGGMHFGGDPSEIFKVFFGGGGPEMFFNMGGGGSGFPGGRQHHQQQQRRGGGSRGGSRGGPNIDFSQFFFQ